MEKYSFFNAIENEAGEFDREYQAEDFAQYFASFVGNGVYANPANNLQVTSIGGMDVSVAAGTAWINGYFYVSDAPKTFSLDIASGSASRIDAIVVRWDLVNRCITTELKQGVAAPTPVPPTMQRDTNIWELCLAEVTVAANVIAIQPNAIKDTRYNKDKCGIVAGVIEQIDLSSVIDDYDTKFNEWFAHIQDVLDENVAAHLEDQIYTTQLQVDFLETNLNNIGDYVNQKFIDVDEKLENNQWHIEYGHQNVSTTYNTTGTITHTFEKPFTETPVASITLRNTNPDAAKDIVHNIDSISTTKLVVRWRNKSTTSTGHNFAATYDWMVVGK